MAWSVFLVDICERLPRTSRAEAAKAATVEGSSANAAPLCAFRSLGLIQIIQMRLVCARQSLALDTSQESGASGFVRRAEFAAFIQEDLLQVQHFGVDFVRRRNGLCDFL